MDIPITTDAEDALGRVKFVDDFYKQISEFPYEDPFVFGLNGPWGTGKSSALNLLRSRLKRNPKIIVVDFNPWYFQSNEIIIRRFYEAIANSINEYFFYPNLRSVARRYSQILSPVFKKYGLEVGASETSNVEEVKEIVESYILETKCRVVIIVDDLDRAYRNELLTVLQLVRLSANFKNTLFVLAYDQAQVNKQLGRLHISDDFLDKIIQSPADLPVAERGSIDGFILYSTADHRSQLDTLLDRLQLSEEDRADFNKRITEFYPTTLSAFFPTLRDAKRFLTSISVRLPAVLSEVYLFDFVLLEVLRVFENAVFQDIWNNRYFYLSAWTIQARMASPLGFEFDERTKEVNRQKIRTHIESLVGAGPQRLNVLQILQTLFSERLGGLFQIGYGSFSESSGKARAQKRLNHPDCFEKYFLLAVPKESIPDGEIEGMLRGWAEAADLDQIFRTTIESFRKRNQISEVLDRLAVFQDKIDFKIAMPLLRAISRNITLFSDEGWPSESERAWRFILTLLNARVEDLHKRVVFEDVLRDMTRIDVALRLVLILENKNSGELWKLKQAVNIPEAKRIISERFAGEFIDAGADIFETNAKPVYAAPYVLYRIGGFSPDLAKVINDYTYSVCEKNPSYIGWLLLSFGQQTPGHMEFTFEPLATVFDADRLASLAESAGSDAWTSPAQEEAVRAFLKWRRESAPKPSDSAPA